MEKDFMNIAEKIEQRRSKVEEALKEEIDMMEAALSKPKENLMQLIKQEVSSLLNDLKQQEKEHYQANRLRLKAIEEAVGISVKIAKNKEGKLISKVTKTETEPEGIMEKIKNKFTGE